MSRTLRIAFGLKNAYRVNSILYALKQIPLLRKVLPDTLYQVRGLKILGNVLSILWEVLTLFLWKGLYILAMVVIPLSVYESVASDALFLHIFLMLTLIGAMSNTYLFNPSKDKQYAVSLMRMDARQYALTDYAYQMFRLIVGMLPFLLYYGLQQRVSLWLCLLMPFFVAGCKMIWAAYTLGKYKKTGVAPNENALGKMIWSVMFLLVALAYGLPALGIVLPLAVSVVMMVVLTLAGVSSLRFIVRFDQYKSLYQRMLVHAANPMDLIKKASQEDSQKAITADTALQSRRHGLEYLNELFIKRHQRVLWQSSKKIAAICLCLVAGMMLVLQLEPQSKNVTNEILLTWLPYFFFIMYVINRGAGFTRVLFMNCDRSLLTYSFYKQPSMVLKLFRIRLREIIKVNLLPALIIGGGLALLLYFSGGTEEPFSYVVLVVSVLCMSIFFSMHYLTVYYLLQPYNAGTEMRSGTYRIVMIGTYVGCFIIMNLRLPILFFGLMCIAFCVVYAIVACVLVYRFAPRTFRLRP